MSQLERNLGHVPLGSSLRLARGVPFGGGRIIRQPCLGWLRVGWGLCQSLRQPGRESMKGGVVTGDPQSASMLFSLPLSLFLAVPQSFLSARM